MLCLRVEKFFVCLLCLFSLLGSLPPQTFGLVTPLNDDTAFVQQCYRDFLDREADAGGLDYWFGEIDSGRTTRAQVVENYINSIEFGQKVSPVARLYFAYFNRIPDYSGLMYWVGRYKDGTPLTTVSISFAGSGEFETTYGNLSNSDFVTLVYQNVLGRDPDANGLAYWTDELDSGRTTRGQVMIGFSEGAENKTLMQNKIYVTMTYIGLLRRSPDQGGFDYWVARMDSGGSGLGLIDGFLNSGEYAARFDPRTCIDATGLTFEQITTLECQGGSIVDLSVLHLLQNLTELTLDENQITDVTPLQGLTNLTILNLRANQISDVTPLQSLTNLTELHLSENQIADVAPLQDLTNLTLLHLSENQIADVTPLQGLTNLMLLHLRENQISDVTPLQGLTNLTELSLYRNQITDVTPLQGLTNLTELHLRENQISDVTPLQGMTNLTELSLNRNQITDVTPLQGLTNLKLLSLNRNQITDVTPLQGLTNLTLLNLSDNQIADVTPLQGLTNLWDLDISDNCISDFSPISGLPNFSNFIISPQNLTCQ